MVHPRGGGGGKLSKKNPEGLERFNKDKKSKRIIIGSLIGIVLLLGVITLYKTFALYEEEKTFNVLKGKIPDFKMINTIVNVNGEIVDTIPSKEEGYLIEDVVCDKGATGVWNNETWQVEIENQREVEITCTVSFIDEFRKLVKIIGSEATNMDELLKNTSDVNKIIASQEAMELIVNSKRLPNDIIQNENYTVNVRKQFLSSTAVSEEKKYNVGLPCYVYSEKSNVVGGFSRYRLGDTTHSDVWNNYPNLHITASYVGTDTTAVSINKLDLTNYKYLESTSNYSRNCPTSTFTGTLYLGIGTNTANNLAFHSVYTVSSTTSQTRTLTTDISKSAGSYYIKVRVIHNGPEKTCTIYTIHTNIALY